MILVLLPAYNEELSLPVLLEKLDKTLSEMNELFQIVVCNDGSIDKTQAVLEEYALKMPIFVLQHKINRGLGESARDLFEYASEITGNGDVVVRLDCDDTHEPEFIPAIVSKIRDGYDVVIASRFARGGGQVGVSHYRAFISICANNFMKFFFRIPGVKEYSCGFRGYKAECIKEAISFYGNDFIQLKGLGFTCTLEKLIKFHLLGKRFTEIPFVLRYDQKVSDTKMVSSLTTLGYIVMTLIYHWPFGGWRRSYKRAMAAGQRVSLGR